MNLIGKRFYCLTVVAKARAVRGHPRWRCKCDCGNEMIVLSTSQLFRGGMKSCCGLAWEPMKAVK